MKMKRLSVIMLFTLMGLFLTACTGSSTQTNSWSGAIATDEYVYYASGPTVYALRADSGNIVWQYPDKASTTRLFYAEPVLVGEQLIVVDYDKKMTSLNAQTGNETWQFDGAKGRYIDSPLVINDLIIAPNADYSLYAVDLSGKLVWSFEAGHALWAKPASDGQTLYFPSMDKYLYAVDATTGTLIWKKELKTSTVARPLLDNGILYIGNLDGTFFAINAEDGSILWEQKVGGGVWAAPILHDGNLYFGDQSGRINILNSTDGKSIQYVETESAILGTGALMEEGIAFGTEDGQLIVIGFQGERLWTRSFDGSLYSNLQRNGDHLLLCLTKGEKPLLTVDLNGNEIWNFSE